MLARLIEFHLRNRLLVLAGIFAAVGLLGLIVITLIVVRAIGRFSELAVLAGQRGSMLGAGATMGALGSGAGEMLPGRFGAAEQASGRFQGAIEQLQKRIMELEQSALAPVGPPLSQSVPRAGVAPAPSALNIQPLLAEAHSAGANGDAVIECLNSLNLGATYRYEKTKRRGMAATKFHVEGFQQKDHRHLPHIAKIIEAAGSIPPLSKQNAIAIFLKLGEAEAHAHGIPLDRVHFHEVGAVDSISDIVGACIALELLHVDEIACSPINVGSGLVETEHGTLPVPAPATAQLLLNKPIYSKGCLLYTSPSPRD